MLDWLLIQAIPAFDNSGKWYARWRWDNLWAEGHGKARAIFNLKESST